MFFFLPLLRFFFFFFFNDTATTEIYTLSLHDALPISIVFCKNGMTMGVGAGQMSRLDSARIASIKAEAAKLSLQGTVVASDAFFPFRDGLDVVVDAGATCVAQPGGSKIGRAHV